MSFHTLEARRKLEAEEFDLILKKLLSNGSKTYSTKKKKNDNDNDLYSELFGANKISRLVTFEEFFREESNTMPSSEDRKTMETINHGQTDLSINIKSYREWICEDLKKSGIIISLIRCCKYENDHYIYHYCGIRYRINPRRVIDQNNYVGIFDKGNVREMIDETNDLLYKVLDKLPPLNKCQLNRIDFCHNYKFKDQKTAEAFMEMVKRCNILPGSELELFYDEKLGKDVISENGIKMSFKNCSISIYNKYAQMIEQNYSFPDIEDARGVIRFEIQALYGKVYYIRKKHGIKELVDFLNNTDELAMDQFNYYFPKLFCKGDYYSYEEAVIKVSNSSFSKKIKKRMYNLLSLTIHNSLDDALTVMKEKLSSAQINWVLNKFNILDLNPSTIPRRLGVKCFQNPLKLLEKAQ